MAANAMSLLALVITAIVTRGALAEDALAETGVASFDTDKDGKISLHEFLEGVHANPEVANQPEMEGWSQRFKEADKDNDMHLNAEELEFFQRKKTLGEIALAGFDSDKDGKISLHELLEHVHANQDVANHPEVQGWSQGFKEADKDKDLHLNAEELEFLFEQAKKEHKDELVQGIEESSKAVLEGWDTDKDGKISLIEFTEHMHNNPEAANHPEFKGWHQGFREADTDKDMHLNTDELKSLLAKVVNDEHKAHPLHDDL